MVSVPSATLFAAMVVDNATFPDPSNDTAPAVTSPVKLKFLAVAKAVAVSALPVTSPVTSPSKLATNVPVEDKVISPVVVPVAVVVPSVNLSTLSSHIKIALSPVLPRSIIIPLSLALEETP